MSNELGLLICDFKDTTHPFLRKGADQTLYFCMRRLCDIFVAKLSCISRLGINCTIITS